MKRALVISVLAVVLLGTAFLVTDCACGTSVCFDGCVVANREIVPAWEETTTHYDSDGGFHITHTHHPEQYLLYVERTDADEDFKIDTTAKQYHTITNGQVVNVLIRRGRWTQIQWVPRIEK